MEQNEKAREKKMMVSRHATRELYLPSLSLQGFGLSEPTEDRLPRALPEFSWLCTVLTKLAKEKERKREKLIFLFFCFLCLSFASGSANINFINFEMSCEMCEETRTKSACNELLCFYLVSRRAIYDSRTGRYWITGWIIGWQNSFFVFVMKMMMVIMVVTTSVIIVVICII